VAGVDLGGTKILAAVVDAENRVLGRDKRPTPAREGGEALLREMVAALDGAIANSGVPRDELAAIGVGSPGPLDVEHGVVLFSPNLAIRDFPLGPRLADHYKRPVMLQNDVTVGGYGEFRLGAGRGYSDVLAAFVGTGIGGCVILDGKLHTGLTGNGGEIGHIVLKAKGPKCGCGRRGCLEALASRTAIARRIRKAIKKGEATALSDLLKSKSARLKSKELAAAYAVRDPVVVREIHRAAHFLGLGLGSLINVLSPEVVIVGGGVAEAIGEHFVGIVRASAHEQAMADPQSITPIVIGALGDDAGVLGAALMAREKFLPQPAG
jgi:glucokinase